MKHNENKIIINEKKATKKHEQTKKQQDTK